MISDVKLLQNRSPEASFCQVLRRCGSAYEQNLGCISVTSFCLFCVVKQHGLKITFHHNVKEKLCHFSTNFTSLFLVY